MSIFALLNKIKSFLSINLLYILLSKSGRILHAQPSKQSGKFKYLESKKKKSRCYEIYNFFTEREFTHDYSDWEKFCHKSDIAAHMNINKCA